MGRRGGEQLLIGNLYLASLLDRVNPSEISRARSNPVCSISRLTRNKPVCYISRFTHTNPVCSISRLTRSKPVCSISRLTRNKPV